MTANPIDEAVLISRRDLAGLCEAIEDDADTALSKLGLSDHEEGFHRGSRDAAKRIRRMMYDGTVTAAQQQQQGQAVAYADAGSLIAYLDSLCDESDEKWEPAQAAIAGILSWQTTGSPVAAALSQPEARGVVDEDFLLELRQYFQDINLDDNGDDYMNSSDEAMRLIDSKLEAMRYCAALTGERNG